MTDWREKYLNKIVQGDCLELMKEIPDKSIDLVLTDPFYGSSGRDGSVHLENDNMIGNRMCSDSLIWFVRSYSKELFRLSKHDSHCYVFSDWRKYKDIQIAYETNGWELRSLIVWNKGNGMGEYWRSTHEFILFFTKVHPKKLTHGGCMNVLNFKPVQGKNKLHDYEKPVDLLKYLIEASSYKDEIVCDPFTGSGSIAVACIRKGRNFIGMDINSDYVKLAEKRIREEKQQLKLSLK